MISLTASHLIKIYGITTARATIWQPHLDASMLRFDITTAIRAAMFIAQVGHESGRLAYVREVWNPARNPAQTGYEGRADLGNTEPGDGARYMGRGLMQITGRKNYQYLSDALGIDFVAQPHLLERNDYAALSAAWFWREGAGLNLGKRAIKALVAHGMGSGVNLNDLADIGDFETVTLCINGGLNGYEDRLKLYNAAREVFIDTPPPNQPNDLRFERIS